MTHKLVKSENKMMSGVCAGLAEYVGWDVTMVRVAWALMTLFTTFPGIILYILFALLMPKYEYETVTAEA